MARMWLLAWTSGTSHSRFNFPGGVITSIWPLLPLAASTGFGIAFCGILSSQTSHGWLQQAMRAAPNAKVRLRPARSLGFLSGPPGSFETCITSLYQRPLASLNVLASHPPFHLPFNILHLLFSPPPIQRILFQGFSFPRISFLCLSMCTMERKIPPLACLLDCLSAHHASPRCIFSSCLTFLLKNFIDFILFFPLALYFHYLLVLCLRMACDVMDMLFLDFI